MNAAVGDEALPGDIVDAAINWTVKLDYGSPRPETRHAFERWLQADPRHALAWQRVAAVRQPFADVPPRLLRATLDAVDSGRKPGRGGRRSAVKLLSLLGLALGAGWVARERTPWQRLVADASTAVGEQRTLRLEDGSVIVLNTDTAVSTRLGSERRLVVLHRGEILVTTGADARAGARRPFWVELPFGRMQALGTRFTVRLEGSRARISVQEGAVELHPLAGDSRHVVQAGESRWLAEDRTEPADLQGFEPDGWSEGVIAGKDLRLADVLDELSRYRSGRIVCDPRVADLRVSGVLHVGDTDQALRFLAQTQPVSVSRRTGLWITVGPAAGR